MKTSYVPEPGRSVRFTSKPQSKKQNKVAIGLALLLIVVLIIGIFMFRSRGKSEDTEETTTSSNTSSSSVSSSSETSITSQTSTTTQTTTSSEENLDLPEDVVTYEGDIGAGDSVSFVRCDDPSPCYHYLLSGEQKSSFPLLDPGSLYYVSAEKVSDNSFSGVAGDTYINLDEGVSIFIQVSFVSEQIGLGEAAEDKAKSFLVFETSISPDIDSAQHSYTEYLLLSKELLTVFPFLDGIVAGQKAKISMSNLKNMGNAAGSHYNQIEGDISIELF